MLQKFTLKSFGKFFTGLLLLCLTTVANAQYVNGPIITGPVSSLGVTAPAGFTWSEIQLNNSTYGFSCTTAAGAAFSVADDFTVPVGQTWNITKFSSYAYSTNYASAPSPFNDVRLRIFNTNPSVGTPVAVFGDLTTNVYTTATATNIYRIAPGAENTARRLWKIESNITVSLPAGTYWIEWQNGVLSTLTSNFAPPVTINGSLAPGNGYQHNIALATWPILQDAASLAIQDMPFILDYTATGTACTATSPGATSSTANPVCPTIPFTLSVATPGSGIGLSYQWQSSATGVAGSYANIAGATSPTLSTSQTAATFYQLVVTCGANPPMTSTALQVTMSTNCYCIPGATSCSSGDQITNVTVGGINNNSTCSVGPPTGYGNYTTSVAAGNLFRGAANPATVTVTNGGTEYVGIWVDYNQNGIWEASEYQFIGSGAGGTFTQNLNVPAGTPLGSTRMRVRLKYNTNLVAGTDQCTAYTFGETEDYTVNIIDCVPVTVSTQPPAATSVVCGGNATIIAAFAGSLPGGYQWEVQTVAGGIWTNLTNAAPYSGVNTTTLTITGAATSMNGYNYRLIYSGACTGTSFTTASTLTVTAIAPTFTQAPLALCAGGSVAQLITVTGGGTGVFTPNGAGSGLFTDAAHLIAYTGTAVTSVYAFPTAAGQYSATYTLVRTNGACVSTPGTVTVIANMPIAGTATIPAATAICANAAGTISVTGVTGGGLTYQWQVSTVAVPAFTNIANGGVYSGATTANLVITNPTAAMTGNKYQVVITSASCGTNTTSNTTTLTVNSVPVVVISASPGTTLAPSQPNTVTLTAAVSSATAPVQYQWYLNTVAIPGATAGSYIAGPDGAGFYSVKVTDANGCATTTSSPISITLTNKPSTTLFIYPSPNSGSFQVRYYNATATGTATEYAYVNVYDSKGSRVFTQRYALNGAYTAMNVVMNAHGRGIYRVDLVDNKGNRLQTGSVFIF